MPWFLPTYGRPEQCQAALDACVESGMTSLGVLFVDAPCDAYRALRIPDNWVVHFATRHWDMGPSMQWCFELFPDAPFYGWIGDDHRPRTVGWDKILETVAGKTRLATCNDDYLALNANVREGVLTGAFCWGGDLVRAVGWWAPPFLRQAGIDDIWVHLINKYYCHEVLVEHLNWRTGKRAKDATDDWVRDNVKYVEDDMRAADEWMRGPEFRAAQERIIKLLSWEQSILPASR